VPVPFFFDRVPGQSGATVELADSDSYVNDFLATSDGLALVKAFMHIPNPKLRRAIVGLVQQITNIEPQELEPSQPPQHPRHLAPGRETNPPRSI
jgi:hypothetical protein